MHDAIAGRYARALAEIVGAGDATALAKTSAEIDLLARVAGAEPALRTWFDDPTVSDEHKAKALESLAAAAKLSDPARRFMSVVIAHRRVAALPAIAAALDAIEDEAMAIVPAATTVAAKMSDAETAAFKAALEKMTGRKVRLSVTVDPAVLGGAVTTVGSRVYDGTLRSHLEALHRQLATAK
jgi:F-type H+-transporting ATPase subunit delta